MAKRTLVVTLVTLVAAACLVAAAVAGFVVLRHRAPTGGVPAELVPPAWVEFRTSRGHMDHVGKGAIACKDCHDLPRDGFRNPGVTPCARCHMKEAARSHPGNDAKKTDCLSCHAFAPKQETPTCLSCHGVVQGHSAAIKTHATVACNDCHSVHVAPSALSRDCASCHKETAPKHANHAGSEGCADCHRPHVAAALALACATCHDGKSLPGATSVGHDACTNCHKPHDFAADGATVCVTCHGKKPTLRAGAVQAHAVCTTCHASHAPSGAADSCAVCHSGIKVEHADRKACISCHAPHTGDVNAVASPCASCHHKVGASDTSVHAGGTSCQSCHKPHAFAPPSNKRALCATCHASETTKATTNPGHSDCATCHGGHAHRPAKAPACGTCHAKERATAPKGHQECLGCHEPHSGARLPKTAACTSCHGDKTGGPHGSSAFAQGTRASPGVNGACTTCHRPHGPSGVATPPVCTTCHARDKLPALHSVAAHDTCASCHSSHAAPRSDRATCTTGCHLDRRDHQPEARLCSGCHVFRR